MLRAGADSVALYGRRRRFYRASTTLTRRMGSLLTHRGHTAALPELAVTAKLSRRDHRSPYASRHRIEPPLKSVERP